MSACPHCGCDLAAPPVPQLTLAPVPPSIKARKGDPRTSKDAAKLAFPDQGRVKWKLLKAFESASRPLDSEEAASRAGVRYTSASTRCTELVRGGWLRVVGERDRRQLLALTDAARQRLAGAAPVGVAAA